MELREIRTLPVDGALIGLSGARQICAIDQTIDYLRKGAVYKTTRDTRYIASSLSGEEAGSKTMLELARGYWGIETKQHYRRDHTQREDHCQVRETRSARNLSLMRSAAIFLYERQREGAGAKKSLPDWQRRNMRDPNELIGKLVFSTG